MEQGWSCWWVHLCQCEGESLGSDLIGFRQARVNHVVRVEEDAS